MGVLFFFRWWTAIYPCCPFSRLERRVILSDKQRDLLVGCVLHKRYAYSSINWRWTLLPMSLLCLSIAPGPRLPTVWQQCRKQIPQDRLIDRSNAHSLSVYCMALSPVSRLARKCKRHTFRFQCRAMRWLNHSWDTVRYERFFFVYSKYTFVCFRFRNRSHECFSLR